MKRHQARDIIEKNNETNNEQRKKLCKKVSEVGRKLLSDCELSIKDVEELGRLIAEKYEYGEEQLIVCNFTELKERLDCYKDCNIDEKPVFVICRDENGNGVTFCIVKQSSIVCLYKDFSNENISKDVKDILEKNFDRTIIFKTSSADENEGDRKNLDILYLKTLETMMVHMKPDKREHFIESFTNSKKRFFEWMKKGAAHLKDELFSLVKEAYYATITSDLNQLSKDIEFKKAIKKFIDDIPLLETADSFRNYYVLLKRFAELDENEIDFDSPEIKQLGEEIEEAKENAFSRVTKLMIDTFVDENGVALLNMQTKYPAQMDKFTKIFETLAKSKKNDKFDQLLEDIASKLDLDYAKLKIFFDNKDETKEDDNNAAPLVAENIEDISKALPKLEPENSDPKTHKTLEELLSEITIEKSETLSIELLKEAYLKVKHFHKSWSNKDALVINEWAKTKQGNENHSEIYETIAVLDRTNELVTGGHKLRDTQILSILTFLLQKGKGQLSQIQTGEGKTTIVSIIAAIKALNGEKVDVITSNPVLAADGKKDRTLFFNLLNLTVATNNLNENYKSGPRECYKADIVYGSISNFQFDFLKDSFLTLSTRACRPFESIILDEVDSMIIDNASHMAKLSEAMPGMESLKYVYIKIWQELYKAEEKITREFGEQLKAKAEELRELSISDEEAQFLYEEYRDDLEDSITQTIKESIKQSNPTKIDIIPSHIQQYADNSLDRWIDSALAAKFIYNEDEQYVIRVKNKEEVIQPVDYANTGMTLKNTIWQYGLHQFLQLKHNLHLTSENLTSCFISNLGYINKYGVKIYGLTGTLGSEAEQQLLSSIYNAGYAKIPTYKDKKFMEIESKIVADEEFSKEIAKDAITKVNEGRAVLNICETIKDAKAIEKVLQNSESNIVIKTVFNEDNAHITEETVNPGDVVIATNIAGRGTDFKTSDELENNGGLHVCVAFLPCNKRVEDQAFGRTARQGNYGTAQLVMKRSEIERLGIDSNSVERIKNIRDQKEIERIQVIQEVKIPELQFQDELFDQFSRLYRSLKQVFHHKREHQFVLDDLKEFWAFWLNNQDFNGSEIITKDVEDEFSHFESEADLTIKGQIQFNPYYSIKQAEFFISSNGKLDEAEQSLNHALRISKNPEILYSAYLKLFEIAIERGRIYTDKCRKAIKDVFLIPYIEPDRQYKHKAREYLELAKIAFKKEVDHIEKMFADEEFSSILKGDFNDQTLECSENLLIKHIISRQQALSLEMNRADSLVQQIDEHDAGFCIGGRVPDYIANMRPKKSNEKKLKSIINNSELAELASNSANITYALCEVHDVCPEIATAAQIQIAGGIALISTGICFPPALPVTSSIGGTMINEGLCDVAFELINMNSDGKFKKGAYVKGKVISYGMSLLTMGINAALQCPKILEKAKNACRWMAETLRKCRYLKRACEYVAVNFARLADWFDKMETLARFKDMTKLEKLFYIDELKNTDLKRLQYLGENIKEFDILMRELQETGTLIELTQADKVISTLRQLTINIATDVTIKTVEYAIISKIITPILASTMTGLKPIIEKHVEKSVRENIDRKKLKYTCFKEIQNIIEEIKQTIDYETVQEIFKNTITGIAKSCNNWKIQLGAFAFDQCSSWIEIYNHAKYLCGKINNKLKDEGEILNENIEKLMKKLIDQLSEEMYSLLISTTIKTCKDLYVVGRSLRANYKRETKEISKCLEINESFKNGGPAGQEQINALSDDLNRPIHIHQENGNMIIIGEYNPGEPIKIRYFSPDENNPSGHYVPLGEDKNWSLNDNNDNNNCLFNAVGYQIGASPVELRQNTLNKIESDPRRYIATNVREVFGSDVLLEGGRTNQPIYENHYPSGKLPIKTAFNRTDVLANLRTSLNDRKKECDRFNKLGDSKKLRYMKRSKSIPQFGAIPDKEEMMMGCMRVKFDNGNELKLASLSGDKPFFVRQSLSDNKDLSFNAEPISFTWNYDGFEFVDSGKPEGNVYDVYNKKDTNVKYSTSCVAQKLFYQLGEYMKANDRLEIVEIDMAESWYKPGNADFTADQVIINRSCSHCEQLLPVATGHDKN